MWISYSLTVFLYLKTIAYGIGQSASGLTPRQNVWAEQPCDSPSPIPKEMVYICKALVVVLRTFYHILGIMDKPQKT